MKRAAVVLLALLAVGCGAWGAAPADEPRMTGLWLEERQDMAVFYWFKPNGTGERLRRATGGEPWQDRVPTPFAWHVSEGALALEVEGEPPRDLGPIVAGREAGVLRFGGATWFGCDSGRLPAEFQGLCGL